MSGYYLLGVDALGAKSDANENEVAPVIAETPEQWGKTLWVFMAGFAMCKFGDYLKNRRAG